MAGNYPLANLDLDSVIERIASGEYQSHIARELGVAKQSLHERISAHPGYRVALKLRNLIKLDDAQQHIEHSPDLARAREEFKAASWRAERECPDEWGAKGQVINVLVNVSQADSQLAGSITDLIPAVHQTVEKP